MILKRLQRRVDSLRLLADALNEPMQPAFQRHAGSNPCWPIRNPDTGTASGTAPRVSQPRPVQSALGRIRRPPLQGILLRKVFSTRLDHAGFGAALLSFAGGFGTNRDAPSDSRAIQSQPSAADDAVFMTTICSLIVSTHTFGTRAGRKLVDSFLAALLPYLLERPLYAFLRRQGISGPTTPRIRSKASRQRPLERGILRTPIQAKRSASRSYLLRRPPQFRHRAGRTTHSKVPEKAGRFC